MVLSVKRLFPQIAIAFVLVLNLDCAIKFLLSPATYTPAFELTGFPGEIAIQGFGVLFVMWNVPYVFAMVDPAKYQVSYFQAVIMQSIGLVGEAVLVTSIPTTHFVLLANIQRFIAFDGAGLFLLLLGYLLLRKSNL